MITSNNSLYLSSTRIILYTVKRISDLRLRLSGWMESNSYRGSSLILYAAEKSVS